MARRKKSDTDIQKDTSQYHSAMKRHQAIQDIAKEFLGFSLFETNLTKLDIQNRDERISKTLDEAGGELPTKDIIVLFCILEEIACKKINEIAALVQTTDPDIVKELIKTLPMQLVSNAKASQLNTVKNAFKKRAQKGAINREANRQPEEKDRKKSVYAAWLKWKEFHHLYKNRADFADTVSRTNPDLSRDTIYKKWVPKWEEQHKSQPPN